MRIAPGCLPAILGNGIQGSIHIGFRARDCIPGIDFASGDFINLGRMFLSIAVKITEEFGVPGQGIYLGHCIGRVRIQIAIDERGPHSIAQIVNLARNSLSGCLVAGQGRLTIVGIFKVK